MTITPAVGVAANPRRRSASALAAGIAVVLVAWLFVGVGSVSAATNSLALRATYDVSATIRWKPGTMAVSSTATVTNTTDQPVDRLAFNLITLRIGAAQITQVLAGGVPATYDTPGQTVLVTLPTALEPAAETTVTIDYTAKLNSTAGSKRELFVKKDGIAVAYRWIPWLSRQQPFKAPNFAETWVTAISPHVTVRLTSPANLVFATSGREIEVNGQTQTFEATDVRDFNFSMSPTYQTRTVDWNGVNVNIFYRSLNPDVLVNQTVRALEFMSDRVGPYPYGRLTIGEQPVASGMESPTLNWISKNLRGARLRHILIHETVHQWFYGIVGNNQATDPFVDESVSDFVTRQILGTFRQAECTTTRLDLAVYDYQGRCYHESIYVDGANYLAAYRDEVGAEAFWAGLRQFYEDRKFGIAGTRRLLDALDAASGFDSQRHAERFPSLYE